MVLDRLKSSIENIDQFFGLTPKNNNVIGSLLNRMGILGGLTALLFTCISVSIGDPWQYSLLIFSLSFSLFSIPILNKNNLYRYTKWMIAIFHPLLLSTFIVISGGSVGEESMLMVSMIMIFVLYRKQPKRIVQFYSLSISAYLVAQFYIIKFPPLLEIVANPYDNFFAFMASAVWLVMILIHNQRGINKQQKQQESLINELKTKNARLKKTSEELEQFTYIASHDLKSPLRTIISFLDLIKRDVDRQKYDSLPSKVDFARSGAEQMNFLVTDILEYSKMTSGVARRKKKINLQELAEKVKFNLTDTIQKKNVELYVFPLPEFYCNETEMTVLFQNFIENGIKYNEESTPTIFVKSSIDEDYLTIQFVDNGIGIEEQYFDKIFQFFKRLHTSERYKGTGLGLGLCKKIIDTMGGTVTVESMMNVGSTFTIKLPVEKPETAETFTTSKETVKATILG